MVGEPNARVLAVVFVLAVVATLAKPTFAAVSCDEAFSQLHLALVDGPHNMSISWTQVCRKQENFDAHAHHNGDDDLAAHARTTTPATVWEPTDAILRVWKRSDSLKQAIAFPAYRKRYFMSWHYHALVTDLVPDEYYCYEVQAGLGDCFKTGPAQTRPAQGVRFASLGDMGTNNSQGTTAALLSRVNELDFVLHDGDIGYGDDLGVFTHDQTRRPYSNLDRGPEGYEIVYDEFMAQIEPIARKIPYMTGAGNHDVSCNILSDLNCAVGQRNFSAYRTRFRMPSAESGAGDIKGMWHSFTFANVHIAVIDTESDYKSAPTTPWTRVGGGRGGGFGDQVAWLDADLARARANPAVDWILVAGHRQMYSSKSILLEFPPLAALALRAAIEDVLVRHKVDVYIGAHIHFYERLAPMSSGSACGPKPPRGGIYHAPQCPVHIVNGAGGNCEVAEGQGHYSGNVAHGVYNEYGFAVMHAHNATHFQGRFFVTTDCSDREEDSFWIIKTPSPPPPPPPLQQHVRSNENLRASKV